MKLRSLFYAVLFALAPVSAAMPQAVNRSALTTQNNTNITTNNAAQITGAKLNAMIASIIASAGTLLDAQTWSSLQTFTVSPVAPTPTVSDKSTTLATTQFVANNIVPHFLAYPGAVCDGTTDTSTAAQAFIDVNKGKRVIFDAGVSCYMAGISLSGSSYNNTVLDIRGELKLVPAATVGTNNFQSAVYTLLGFSQCDRCGFIGLGVFNLNRAAQQAREQTIGVTLAGVTNFFAPTGMQCKETRGDCLLIGQANLLSTSANSNGITIGPISCYNSAGGDGRNVVSILSGDNITIGQINYADCGGTISGAVEPSGFDVEADFAYQSITNVDVAGVFGFAQGTCGLCIQGVPTGGTLNVRGVHIGPSRIINTSPSTALDAASALTQSPNHVLEVRNAQSVQIASFSGEFPNTYGDAVLITNSDKVTITGAVKHVREGARIGGDVDDNSFNGATNVDLFLNVDSISRYGIRTGKVSDSRINGNITTPVAGMYTSSLFGVYAQGTNTFTINQNRVTYGVGVAYDANWVRAYRNDATFPINNFTDTKIVNANFGVSWPNYILMNDMRGPIVINSYGYNIASALGIPTNGYHALGETVLVASPAVGSPLGYVNTAAGTSGTWVTLDAIQRGKNIAVPVNNGVVTLTSAAPFQIINPAGTLGGVTVTFPASPVDAQPQSVAFEQAITTLTFSGGTVVGAPSTATAGQGLSFIYDAGTAKWYRTQ